jgi:tetratricopeptide (TPR) repeat protein
MNPATTNLADLSLQNPWPGLRAFTENDSEFFFGRERETAELLDLVQRSPVVVLYGQSGLGKTSLLQAGLFPGLKRNDFLPIRLRFDHSDGAPPLAEQVKGAISSELDRANITGPRPSTGETLWEYFHRNDVDFWGPRNRLLTPVIVLDQFEEVFTLGQRTEETAKRVAQFSTELESLLEHRPPDAVRERLEAHPDEAQQYNLRRQAVKFVIALREDFLADLDPWRVRMPSLLPNRFRLERMTGAQALDVVQRAGRALIEPEVARDIVDFVSTSQRKQTSRAVEQRDVEPALLSVVCDELNRRRVERGQSRITGDLLSGEREEIIRSFYERAFDGVDPRVRNWVEDELLTDSGYRDRAALEDATRQGLPEADFDQLVNHRILHREERSGVVWLELTHDLLSDPASESRSLREQRRQAEAAKKQADEAKKQKEKYERDLRKSRLVTAVFGVLLIGTAAALYFAVVGNRLAKQRETERERSYQAAGEMAERLSFGIGGGWVPAATVFQIIRDTEKSYVDLANQGTPSRDQKVRLVQRHARFLAKAADALYQIGHFEEGLKDAQSALELLKGFTTSESANGLVQLTLAEALYQEGFGLLSTGQIDRSKRDFENATSLAASLQNSDLKLDMGRVYVLSQIGLGQAESQSLAYDKALLHFKDAMNSIDASSGGADEALSWKVSALIGTGSSQWDDKQAQNWFGKASDILRPIAARDGGNPQWKRMSAELAYDQGFAALRLGQYDTAKGYFEQSETAAEDLYKRDSENLMWRLIRVRSWRGLGLIHYFLGEWDLAQSLLNQSEQFTKELSDTQQSWTGAGFLRGVLFMALGDVQEYRYIQSTGTFKDSHDLDEAFQMYSESRDLLRKSKASAPGNLDFVREVALALAKQGYLRSLQADAARAADSNDKNAQKKAQESADQKDKEALDFYSQAFKELELVESLAKDSPEIMQDKASLHRQTGDALRSLNRPQESKSSYTNAVAMLANLVKKAPSSRNYGQLASARIALGDTQEEAKDFTVAYTTYESAMEAVTKALSGQPQDTEFIRRKAVIQSRFSDVWFSRGDLKKALDELEKAFATLWTAMQADYSDEILNGNLKIYTKRLDRIKSALLNPKSMSGSQGQPLTPEQSKTLLERVNTLAATRDPELLLAHYGQAAWSLPPLLPGGWRMLAGTERDAVLRQLSAVNKNVTPNQVRGIRRLPLDFYDNAALYELEVQAGGGWNGIISYVQRASDWVLLDGTSTPIHGMNRKSPPKLDTIDRAIAYLRFFVAAIQAPDEGTFRLIDQAGDIDWFATATSQQRANVANKIKPLIVEGSPDGEWEAIGTVELGGALSEADFRLSRVGIVNISHDRTIGVDLPIFVQTFSDGVRVQETMETLQHAKLQRDLAQAQRTLNANPNDKDALQQLPSLLTRSGRWKDAADAEKKWIAYVQREIKDDADRRTTLLNAYLSLSWYQLFARDFAGALASSETGKKLDESDLHIDTNRAHALLFLGRTSEADAIYLGNRGKKMASNSNQTWDEVILKDFDDLEKGGINSPEFARLRKLLQPQTK